MRGDFPPRTSELILDMLGVSGVVSASLPASAPDNQTIANLAWAHGTGVYNQYDVFIGDTGAKALALANNNLEACPLSIATCRQSTPSSNNTHQVTGLPPGQQAYFLVRAKYTVSGVTESNTVISSITTAALDAKIVWEVSPWGADFGDAMPFTVKVSLRSKADDSLMTSYNIPITATIASGDGTLINNTSTIVSGYGYLAGLTYLDADTSNTNPFQLIVSASGIDSTSASDAVENTPDYCRKNDNPAVYRPLDGGCKHLPSGLVMSKSFLGATWHDLIRSDTGENDNAMGSTPDTSPNAGICQDMTSSNQSDWYLPSLGELLTMSGFQHYHYGSLVNTYYSSTTNLSNGYFTDSLNGADSSVTIIAKFYGDRGGICLRVP